jgi:hypothetical protein
MRLQQGLKILEALYREGFIARSNSFTPELLGEIGWRERVAKRIADESICLELRQ